MTWITHLHNRLSDHVHARGDAFAGQAGWTITRATGRFGFGARVYRDPRFGQRRRQAGITADGRVAQAAFTPGPVTGISEPPTGKAAALATQAVLDAITTGQLRGEQLEGCEFWAAQATQHHRQAAVQTDHGTAGRELENWTMDNGRTGGPNPGREP
jgi:hypothetical protein